MRRVRTGFEPAPSSARSAERATKERARSGQRAFPVGGRRSLAVSSAVVGGAVGGRWRRCPSSAGGGGRGRARLLPLPPFRADALSTERLGTGRTRRDERRERPEPCALNPIKEAAAAMAARPKGRRRADGADGGGEGARRGRSDGRHNGDGTAPDATARKGRGEEEAAGARAGRRSRPPPPAEDGQHCQRPPTAPPTTADGRRGALLARSLPARCPLLGRSAARTRGARCPPGRDHTPSHDRNVKLS